MTNDPTEPDDITPENTEAHTETAQPPTGTEGDNPALEDTGHSKAAEGKTAGGEDAERKNPEDMDLTPLGLSDEPARQEDPESFAKPENS